jgi:DNA-binding NarL/FixJ family response regulator
MCRERVDARNHTVLTLMADGYQDREIAAQMHYSLEHIKKVAYHLRLRHGARNRTHLVALALKRGMIE